MSTQGKQVSADDGGETLKLQKRTLKDDFAGVDIAALDNVQSRNFSQADSGSWEAQTSRSLLTG